MATLQTVTIDTNASPWVLPDGTKIAVSDTDQTMYFEVDDLGTTAIWRIGGGVNNILLSDGSRLNISSNGAMSTQAKTFSDGTAMTNGISLFCSIDGGPFEEVKVTTMQCADVDGNNTDLTLTFEYPGKPYQWTWASINTTAS